MAESKLGIARVPIEADLEPLEKGLEGARGKVEGAFDGITARISKSLGALGPAAATAGKAMAAGLAAGTAGLAAVGAAAMNVGGEFDAAYDAIRIGTGATGDALKGLQSDFKAVVKDVPTDFGLASQVIADLNTRTGQTGQGLQTLSKNILEMSRITGTDAVNNVGLATRLFGDWSVATEDQAETLDKVFRASQATGIGVDALMGKVVQFGAPLRQMGFSFDESIAMLGKWEKEGVNAELVLGSLRIAAGNFAQAGVPLQEGLEGAMKAIAGTKDESEALNIAMATFGARAGPDMAAAIREGRFAIDDYLKAIQDGGDTIIGLGEETGDAAEKMQRFWNRVKVAMEPVASVAFDTANVFLDKFLPIAEQALTALVPALQTVATIAGKALGGDLVGAFGDVQSIVGDALPQIQAKLGEWAGAFLAWVGPMIPPLLDELAKMAGAAFDWVKEQIKPLGKRLKDWAGEFIAWVGPMIPPLLGELADLAGEAWDWIKTEGPVLAKQLGVWAGEFIAWVAPLIPPLLLELGKVVAGIGVWILTRGVPELVRFALNMGSALITGLLQGLGNLASSLQTAITRALQSIDFWVGPFHITGQGISISWPSFTPPGGGSPVDSADNPMLNAYAEGGVVPGPVGMPQLAIVHGGETVIPAGHTGVAGGSLTINGPLIDMRGSTFRDEADENRLVRKIEEVLSRDWETAVGQSTRWPVGLSEGAL